MYTTCSHCQSTHRVSRQTLLSGRGRMHCERCGQEFDALETLSRDPPDTPETAVSPAQGALFPLRTPVADESARADPMVEVLTAHADFIEPPVAPTPPADATTNVAVDADESFLPDLPEHAAEEESPDGEPLETSHDEPGDIIDAADLREADIEDDPIDPEEPATALADGDEPPEPVSAQDQVMLDLRNALELALEAPTPSFIPAPALAPVQNGRRWIGAVAIAALLALLGAQSVLAERARLAADAQWRPWLERACRALHCTLPPWREPAAMQILSRDVRPHPSMEGALVIGASFRNDARWPQPWPQLDLTLSDINGQPIARRRFAAADYLGHLQAAPLIQPGQSASIALEVRDPGKQAVAFEFEFR